jgi:hypothetical protein
MLVQLGSPVLIELQWCHAKKITALVDLNQGSVNTAVLLLGKARVARACLNHYSLLFLRGTMTTGLQSTSQPLTIRPCSVMLASRTSHVPPGIAESKMPEGMSQHAVETCTPMVMAPLFAIVKLWNQPQ